MEDLEPIKELVWKIKKATNKKPPPILLIGNKTDMPGREVQVPACMQRTDNLIPAACRC